MSFLTILPRDRYDPKAFAAFRPGSAFHPGTAKAMAWMSQLAYESDEVKVRDILHMWGLSLPADGMVSVDVETTLPQASTQCTVATRPGMTVVAFAGTDPLVVADWISDFDIGIKDGSGVANGFAVAAKAAEPKLQKLLERSSDGHAVYLTGHSLGGALAVLTASAIGAKTLPAGAAEVEAVYTFGMPRPGLRAFAADYNNRLGARTFRMVQGDDLVPSVAPSFLQFCHVGHYVHCDRGGKFDAATVAAGAGSDAPDFVAGVAKELAAFLHRPLSGLLSATARIKLGLALAFGRGPGMRTDPGGIAIELLPPRIRDHMPDRYIGGF
jgi:triacylglycerol lipase